MPITYLRGLPSDLVSAVRAYARDRDLALPDAVSALLRLGLQMAAGRAMGARALNASRTPTERSKAASRASRARWGRERKRATRVANPENP